MINSKLNEELDELILEFNATVVSYYDCDLDCYVHKATYKNSGKEWMTIFNSHTGTEDYSRVNYIEKGC